MRLSKVRVRNFRCIKDISVDLEDTTVLIGENNSGKTAFLEAIRICLSRSRGELLFARCWLLVEGETETALFSGVADALNLDLERAGVRCVEFGQTDVGMLAKVANQLGIRCYCVIDNDSGANKYRNAARDQLDDAEEVDRIILPYENVERFLCETGFGGLYEARMSGQKRQPEAARDAPGYWEQVLAALPN